MSKKKVIISACLLGEICRYDGKSKKVNAVVEAFKDYGIIPFCPEAPLFGTPRERINLIGTRENYRVVTDETKLDVTKLLEEEIHKFTKLHPLADAIVLKSKSPSCGLGNAPILNDKKEIIAYGNGIAANIFLKKYKKSTIKDESIIIFYDTIWIQKEN